MAPCPIEHFANLTATGRPEAIRLLAGTGRLAQLVLGLDAAAVRMAARDARILTEAFATALLYPAIETKSKYETVEALARFAVFSKEISRPDALAAALRALVAGDWTDEAFAATAANSWPMLSTSSKSSAPHRTATSVANTISSSG